MGRFSYAYLKQGYRVRATEGFADGDHWQGGPACHRGAECQVCKRPLLLLWDINCADPRFAVKSRPRFGDLVRLPLYYCWTCSASFFYQVIAPDRIRILQHVGEYQGDDFPYPNYPTEFPRVPLELADEAPDGLQAIVDRWERAFDKKDDTLGDCLEDSERELLEAWYGHPVTLFGVDFVHHQLGGLARLAQGDSQVKCPNPECKKPGVIRRALNGPDRMSFLAVILNDPPGGLPMIEELNDSTRENWNSLQQVIFHICERCLTIWATNACD